MPVSPPVTNSDTKPMANSIAGVKWIRARQSVATQLNVLTAEGRRFYPPASHQVVERQPGPGPFAVSKPADARRQSLKRHPLLRQTDPARQRLIVRKQVQHGAIRLLNIVRVARQRHPTERTPALTE